MSIDKDKKSRAVNLTSYSSMDTKEKKEPSIRSAYAINDVEQESSVNRDSLTSRKLNRRQVQMYSIGGVSWKCKE